MTILYVSRIKNGFFTFLYYLIITCAEAKEIKRCFPSLFCQRTVYDVVVVVIVVVFTRSCIANVTASNTTEVLEAFVRSGSFLRIQNEDLTQQL